MNTKEMTTLSSVASVLMGQAPAGRDCNKDGIGTPFVKVGEFGAERPLIREWTTDPKRMAKCTDVLLCVVGATCGKINLGEDCAIGRSVAAIRPHDGILNQFFLHYFLQGKVMQLRNASQGAAQTVISKEMIFNLEIPVPPLAEQERIVAILNDAFAGITTATAHAERNLQSARELFQSVLQSTFEQKGEDWVEMTLGEIGKTQTGSTPKTSDQSNYGDFISFVKPGDFNPDGTLDYDKAGLSESGATGARKVPAGSVLMVCIGATIGKCGYCDQDVTTNQQVNALTPSDESSNRFIYYQMLTEAFQRKVIHASGQATLPIINKSKWSALSIWLPPTIAEQKKVTAKFDALSEGTQRLAAIYERKLEALAELKQSLLQRAFAGELTASRSAKERAIDMLKQALDGML